MRKTKSVSISLPMEVWERVESERKDISRSKFILRILEKIWDDTT
jgi:hypothetical protein